MISLRDWVGAVTTWSSTTTPTGRSTCAAPRRRRTPSSPGRSDARSSRPTLIPAPAFAIKLGAARLAPELLGSTNAVPQALMDSGYAFRDRDVVAVVAAGLAQSA